MKLSNPQFDGQTKEKLGNAEVTPIVNDVVREKFQEWLEFNPKFAKTIIEKTLNYEPSKRPTAEEVLEEIKLYPAYNSKI